MYPGSSRDSRSHPHTPHRVGRKHPRSLPSPWQHRGDILAPRGHPADGKHTDRESLVTGFARRSVVARAHGDPREFEIPMELTIRLGLAIPWDPWMGSRPVTAAQWAWKFNGFRNEWRVPRQPGWPRGSLHSSSGARGWSRGCRRWSAPDPTPLPFRQSIPSHCRR